MDARRLVALAALLGVLQPLQLGAAFRSDPVTACSMTACTCRHHGRAGHAELPKPQPAGAACHLTAGEAAATPPAAPGRDTPESPTICGCGQSQSASTMVVGHAPFMLLPALAVTPDGAAVIVSPVLARSVPPPPSDLHSPPPRPLV